MKTREQAGMEDEDYVTVGYDVAGYVRAFTTGTLECCKSAAKVYRRTENGMRVYPTVKVMTVKEWDAINDEKWVLS